MALINRDPFPQMNKLEEAHLNLRICPHGCQGRKCPQLLDANNYSYIRTWSEPTFGEAQTLGQVQTDVHLAPVAPSTSVRGSIAAFANPSHPLGISIGDIIFGHRIEGLCQDIFHEYDVCVYCIDFEPIPHPVYKAVATKCHGKTTTVSGLLRHIATSIFFAIREMHTPLRMSNLEVCRIIMRLHLRYIAVLGRSGSTVYIQVC
ncbi:hypothetical protein AB1N83_009300 [Pleurotus pulmonarius]